MSVLCAHCGEALMGAVNRCWKCGTAIESHAGPVDIPPIRRPPVDLTAGEPLAAAVLEDAEPTSLHQAVAVRRGSPFARDAATVIPAGHSLSNTIPLRGPAPAKSEFAGPQLATAAALVVSGVGLLLTFYFPVASVLFAACAIGFGIWGLFSPNRKMAIAALVCACLVLGWGGIRSLIQLYQLIYGVHPFA